jgi:putative hemolysin
MILLSAFFSGAEIAFISANKLGVEVLKNKGNKKGEILAAFYEKPRDFVSAMLVGNNIALVILTMLLTVVIEPLFQNYFSENSLSNLIVITLIITVIVLIFGEFLPKTVFSLFSNDILYQSAYVLRFFIWLLFIPTKIMNFASNFILTYLLRSKNENPTSALTRIDLEHFIQDNVAGEQDFDKSILTNALKLDELKVRDCMVPRNEIIYVDKSDAITDIIETFKSNRVSRVLVVDGDLENVLGYLHHLNLLSNPKRIDKLIKNINFVPDAMAVKELLNNFIRTRTNICCVVDEFGGLNGLITLEDILEEIFGEIDDEYDYEDLTEKKISENEFIFSGRLEIDYLNEKYPELQLPEGEYHTLSGFIVMSEESIPEEGHEVTIGNKKYIMLQVSGNRIDTIKVLLSEDAEKEK